MKKIKILFLSFVLAFCLGGCQIPFTSKQITVPFLEKEPAEVLSSMFEKMFQGEGDYSFETDIKAVFRVDDIEYEFKESPDGFGLGSLTPEKTGKVRVSSLTDKVSGEINRLPGGRTDFSQDLEMEVDFDESMSFKFGLNFLQSGEETFFKLNKMPQMGLMFMPEDIEDKWLLVSTSSSLSAFHFNLDELTGAPANDESEKAEKIFEKMRGSFKESDFIEFVQRLADEKIDGNNCYHYQIKLNRASVDKLFETFFKEIEDNFKEEDFAEGLQAAKDILGTWKTVLTEEGGDLWVDKKDFYLRKYSFDMKLDLAKSQEFEKVFKEKSSYFGDAKEYDFDVFDLSFSVGGRFFDFNNGAKIEKPSEYSSLQEIIEKAFAPFGGSFSDSDSILRDSERISDIKMVQTGLELYYNDEGKYPESVIFDNSSPIKTATSTYFMAVPANPQPSNDGLCPYDFNYQYEVSDDSSSYAIKYCLGSDIGGLSAGRHVATPVALSDGTWEDEYGDELEDFYSEADADTEADIDTDADGLDDFSEEIFGTDPNNPDSDGDSYSDGSEVENGYNPSGSGTLEDFYKEQMGEDSETIAL